MISIVKRGNFRTGMTDMQEFLEKVNRVWEEVPTQFEENYGETVFDACELFFL